jgi:hypothetical protein
MTLGLLAVRIFSAEPADDIKPPSGYRQWFHVNTMIVDKGSPLSPTSAECTTSTSTQPGSPRSRRAHLNPDKSTFVTDLHELTVSDRS